MKSIMLSFFGVTISLFIWAQNSHYSNDLDKLILKGRIKTLAITNYSTVNNSGVVQLGEMKYKHVQDFNTGGNKIKECRYGAEGNLFLTISCKYDSNSYKTEEKWSWDDSDNDKQYAYTYDSKGHCIEESVYMTFSGSKSIITYNELGYEIERSRYKFDGSFSSKSTYKYDEKGLRIEDNLYFSNEELFVKIRFKYDVLGNLIEKISHDYVGGFDTKHKYKYDSNNHEIEDISYKSDGTIESKFTNIYEYDPTGNWVRKTEFLDGSPQSITERKIEYY